MLNLDFHVSAIRINVGILCSKNIWRLARLNIRRLARLNIKYTVANTKQHPRVNVLQIQIDNTDT
jgi:hypothetical protein